MGYIDIQNEKQAAEYLDTIFKPDFNLESLENEIELDNNSTRLTAFATTADSCAYNERKDDVKRRLLSHLAAKAYIRLTQINDLFAKAVCQCYQITGHNNLERTSQLEDKLFNRLR